MATSRPPSSYFAKKGFAASAKRDDRDNNQGVVALKVDGNVGTIVLLKSETDFVAGSDQFKAEAAALVDLVIAERRRRRRRRAAELEALKITLKEKIELGESIPLAGRRRQRDRHYEHVQGGRGVNGVLVEIAGAATSWHTTSPSTSRSLARPTFTRDEVPSDVVEAERKTLETITLNEGKPKQHFQRSSKVASTGSSRMSACSAAIRQGRQADDQAASSASADRPLRPSRIHSVSPDNSVHRAFRQLGRRSDATGASVTSTRWSAILVAPLR